MTDISEKSDVPAGLKFAVWGMGILLVVGFLSLIVAAIYKYSSSGQDKDASVQQAGIVANSGVIPNSDLGLQGFASYNIDLSAGEFLLSANLEGANLVLSIRGKGYDRVLIVDPTTGALLREIYLRHVE